MLEEEIMQNEADLMAAMRSSDIEFLGTLLHENLCFLIPTGETITKEMDLNNYKSGKIKISNIEILNSEIHKIDDETINVVAKVMMTGHYENQPVGWGV